MNTGQLISGLAHVGLVGVAVFGGAFKADPLPFEVTQVTAFSEAEYAALIARPEPDALANVNTPEPPDAGEAPAINTEPDTMPNAGASALTEVPTPDDAPASIPEAPQAEVADTAPTPPQPPEDVAVLVPEPDAETDPDAAPEAAPRVAPEPVAQPDPDVEIDDVDRQATDPDTASDTAVPEERETAREGATTEIVTEAERAEAAAPALSVRPKSRPAAPEPEAEPDPQPATDQQTDTADATPAPDAVDTALAEALGQSADPPSGTQTRAAQGPPLTSGERDGLRVAVQQCWNVGSLSSEALSTTVVVAVSMNEDGRPRADTIRMLDFSGGTQNSARQAFEAARRAIIRCGSRGFELPREKYASWRDIEMTFNPENMRIK